MNLRRVNLRRVNLRRVNLRPAPQRHPRMVVAVIALAIGLVGCGTGTSVVPSIPVTGSTPSPAPTPTVGPTPGYTTDASGCPLSQPAALAAGETRAVTIETAKGSFTITVDGALSPIAAGNFVALAACGFYDGVVFHRVATLPDGTPFVIQGGDPTGTGAGGPGYTIQDEPVTASYQRGTVAMARTQDPNSQGSQFFIVLDDADGPILQSYNTYAIFGQVTSGMDVVDAIYAAADAELPTNPIAMDSVTVTNP